MSVVKRVISFFDGIEVQDDFEVIERLASIGNPKAQTMLGVLLETGRVKVPAEYDSYYWFKRAAANNCEDARNYLEVASQIDAGSTGKAGMHKVWNNFPTAASNTSADEEQLNAETVEFLEQLATAGSLSAQNILGNIYAQGSIAPTDILRAVYWLEKSTNNNQENNAKGFLQLGVKYHAGFGVDRDFTKAKHCYQKAAEAGCNKSLFFLGVMYHFGHGVDADLSRAVELYSGVVDSNPTDEDSKLIIATAHTRLNDLLELAELLKRDYKQAFIRFNRSCSSSDNPINQSASGFSPQPGEAPTKLNPNKEEAAGSKHQGSKGSGRVLNRKDMFRRN